jgi:hypothetical protein
VKSAVKFVTKPPADVDMAAAHRQRAAFAGAGRKRVQSEIDRLGAAAFRCGLETGSVVPGGLGRRGDEIPGGSVHP